MTIKNLVFSFMLMLPFYYGVAQQKDTVRVEGFVADDTGKALSATGVSVSLAPYREGGGYFSCAVKADGTFSLAVPVSGAAFYYLKYRGMKMDVLLTPTEPVFHVRIIADYNEVKSMKNTGSLEYEAYRSFKHINTSIHDKLHTYLACRDEKKCVVEAKKSMADLDDELLRLQKTLKGTLAANVLVPIAQLPEINATVPLRKQLEENFFNTVPFNNAVAYVMPELNNKLTQYIEEIADTSAVKRLAFITALWTKANSDRAAQKNILTLLLENFTINNREPYLESLVQWAAKHTELRDEQPVIYSKIELVSKTIPGVHASEVKGEDVSGKQQSLSMVYKNNKLTLLIFWSSDCSHCRKSLPEFARLYQEYHDKGLEIFAASIEDSSDKWKEFLGQHNLPWHNIIVLPESTAHADFYIQYTPTLVLINSDGVIVRRFLEVDDLDKSIGDFLK